MDFETEQKIRQRAYELWVSAGRPEGSSLRFWKDAEAQIVAEAADHGHEQTPGAKE